MTGSNFGKPNNNKLIIKYELIWKNKLVKKGIYTKSQKSQNIVLNYYSFSFHIVDNNGSMVCLRICCSTPALHIFPALNQTIG